jgi:hypothetical protein
MKRLAALREQQIEAEKLDAAIAADTFPVLNDTSPAIPWMP